MTTETKQLLRGSGVTVLLGAAAAGGLAGAMLSAVGALLGGSPAAYGGLVGTAVAVVVLAFGSFSLDLVAGLMPSAALAVAVLTYAVQVVAMVLVFAGLAGSDLLGTTLHRGWLGGALVVATLVWTTVQVVLSSRRRILAFELPQPGDQRGQEADTR